MRLPNGYGSVIDLGKNRRKRYAVRITDKGKDVDENGKGKQRYRYLGYFEKSKDAYGFLAKYNAGEAVKEHIPLIEQPTFAEVYNKWYEYRHNMNKKPSEATSRAYRYGFNMCESLHERRFNTIKVDDLQDVVDKYKDKSRGTVGNIKTIFFALYEYAMKRQIIEKDISKLIDYEWSEERHIQHVNFKVDEIKSLWEYINVEYVDWILIMIYTGLRVSEFCEIKTENVHLNDRYMIGGKKTAAGIDRVIPLHKKIVPLVKKLYDNGNKYLIMSKNNCTMNYKTFLEYWNDIMKTVNMNHLPHDTRYTTATLLDNDEANKVCIKKILGHAIQDITDGVYTQKDLPDLLEAIDKIKI